MQIINKFATEDFVMSLLDKTDLDLFYSALIRGKANPNEPQQTISLYIVRNKEV